MSNWMSVDFGTSSSAAAILRGREPELATPLSIDATGSKIFPTVAFVDVHGKIFACHDAENMKMHDLARYVREFKLDLQDKDIAGLGVNYAQVVAEILKELKRAAEYALEEPIENVVLTIPAIYGDEDIRREIMERAAKLAGFTRVEMIREAQAAAIYYDYVEQQCEGITLVYDLGGGTFDPAIIKHASQNYEILGCHEGIEVGGKYFTEKITRDYIAKNTVEYTPEGINSVKEKCEHIKRYLSTHEEGEFPVGHDKNYRLARRTFEGMIGEMVDRTLQACEKLVADSAGIEWKDIQRVLLIGGSCYIPLVREKIGNYLISRGVKARLVWRQTETKKSIDPQFAVALGAAVYALKTFMPPPARPAIGSIQYMEAGELKTVPLKEGNNTVGRKSLEGQKSDIAIDTSGDRHMSRVHFSIKVEYDAADNLYRYVLKDENSTNGTKVDGKEVTSIDLKSGDTIKAGHEEITIYF